MGSNITLSAATAEKLKGHQGMMTLEYAGKTSRLLDRTGRRMQIRKTF